MTFNPFTGIYYSNNLTPPHLREEFNRNFLINHPKCIYYEIKLTQAIAYYTDPIYTAVILQKSKHYLGKTILLKDYQSRRLHPRVLTITNNYNKDEIQQLVKESKGHVIGENSEELIVKFSSFSKATKIIRALKRSNIDSKFTNKKTIKNIKSISE